jgi:hypothetical protein
MSTAAEQFEAASPYRIHQALLRRLHWRRCGRSCSLLHAGRRPLFPRTRDAIACEDEAVIEWSMQWTSREDGERYIVHGAEWYAFGDGLISEIRAYYDFGRNQDTGLVDFPYAERGYTVVERTAERALA